MRAVVTIAVAIVALSRATPVLAQTPAPRHAPVLRDYDDNGWVAVAPASNGPRLLRDYDDTVFVTVTPATHALHNYDDSAAAPPPAAAPAAHTYDDTPAPAVVEPAVARSEDTVNGPSDAAAFSLPAVRCVATATVEISARVPRGSRTRVAREAIAREAEVIRAAPPAPGPAVELPAVRVTP